MAAREANGPGSALTKPRRPRQFNPLTDQDDAEFGAASNQTSGPGAWNGAGWHHGQIGKEVFQTPDQVLNLGCPL